MTRKALSIAALVSALLLLTCTKIYDLDFGFYLAVGRHMLATGAIPQKEFYLPLLADHAFGSQWLLSALIFAGVWNTLGVAGFIALKALCYTGAFVLAALTATKRGVPIHTACLCAAIVACCVAFRFVERPAFFSALFYGVVLFALQPGCSPARPRIAALIALISVWPFLHAEWIVGLFLFGCLICTTTLKPVERIIAIVLSIIIPTVLFLVIHPAGIGPLFAPFGFLTGASPDFKILEYEAATWKQLWPAIPLLIALAVVAVCLFKKRRFAEAILLTGLLLLTIKLSRAILPALLIGTPWLASALNDLARKYKMLSWFAGPSPHALPVLGIAAAMPLCAALWLSQMPHKNLGFGIDPMLDTRGVAGILEKILAGKGAILAEYGYTSLLLANPSVVRQGVIMDGRQEVYSAVYLNTTYLDCFFAKDDLQRAALDRAGVSFYAESWRDSSEINLIPKLRAQGWELIAWDNSGRVLARPGIAKKFNLPVYTTDPAHLELLESQPKETIQRALAELRQHNAELAEQKLPATHPLCAEATLELAAGDLQNAADCLDRARADGAERLASYWRARLTLATLKDDVSGMREAAGRIKNYELRITN